MRPKCSRSGNTSSCCGRNAPPRIDQVDARQPVLRARSPARAGASSPSSGSRCRPSPWRRWRRSCTRGPATRPMPVIDAGRRRLAVVHAVGGELADLEERRARDRAAASTRSRGSSLPRADVALRAPPRRRRARLRAALARRSSTSARIASALARNSAERGSICVFRAGMDAVSAADRPAYLAPARRIIGACPASTSPAASSSSRPIRIGSTPSSPGATFRCAEAGPLRDDVSTDEITPLPAMVHFDARARRHRVHRLHGGGERFRSACDALRRAGFGVHRRRPALRQGHARASTARSPSCSAGVRLVIAESFERIYRQNADNLGLLTSAPTSASSSGSRAGEADRRSTSCSRGRDAAGRRRSCAPAACCATAARTCTSGDGARRADARAGGRRRCSRRSSRHRRHARRAAAGPAPASSCAPTCASSTSTTPACARTCSSSTSGADASRCTTRRASSRFEDHLSYVAPQPGARGEGLIGGVQRPVVARTAPSSRGTASGPRLRRRRRRARSGISHALVAERLRAAGPADRRHRFAHAAQRRARLRRLRRRHDRHGQRLRHRRGAARQCRRCCASRSTGALPPGVSAKDLVLHLLALPEMRAGAGVGKRVRVRRRRGARARRPTSARR